MDSWGYVASIIDHSTTADASLDKAEGLNIASLRSLSAADYINSQLYRSQQNSYAILNSIDNIHNSIKLDNVDVSYLKSNVRNGKTSDNPEIEQRIRELALETQDMFQELFRHIDLLPERILFYESCANSIGQISLDEHSECAYKSVIKMQQRSYIDLANLLRQAYDHFTKIYQVPLPVEET